MATKEEYQEELDFLIETAIRTELRNRAAEALAERDAAREELAKLKAAQPSPALDLAAWIAEQRDFSLATFGPGARTRGVVAHIRKELAEVEADPDGISEWIDVVILALDGAWRAGHEPREIADALRAKLDINKARTWPDWRTMPQDGPIEHDRSGEQPSPAPVVGGVTEEMLDEIQHLVEQYPYCPGVDEKAELWLKSARAAIRAQKRVDVEALRDLASQLIGSDSTVEDAIGVSILRAIGDEPAEAPVADPRMIKIGSFDAVLLNTESPVTEPQTKTCTVEMNAEQLAQLHELRPARRPEPAAGNLTGSSALIAKVEQLQRINTVLRDHISRTAEALDLAYQAEGISEQSAGADEQVAEIKKLRARVAELEKSIGEMYERCRENSEAWAVLTGRNWWQTRDEGSLLLAAKDVKARADAAEAKLAALGENPIPRALVERLRDEWRKIQCDSIADDLDSILAGREPGVAS